MRKLFLIFAVIGFACSSNVSQTKKNKFEINQTLNQDKKLYIEDSTLYSEIFINELRNDLLRNYKSIKLVDKELRMISNSSDDLTEKISKIPTILQQNAEVKFKSATDSCIFELFLRMKNLTTFSYTLKENQKIIKEGEATLGVQFYLGCEPIEDENGNETGAYEYFTNDLNNTRIRINMSGKTAVITLEEIPLLIRE